jgi:hypothetical protein
VSEEPEESRDFAVRSLSYTPSTAEPPLLFACTKYYWGNENKVEEQYGTGFTSSYDEILTKFCSEKLKE